MGVPLVAPKLVASHPSAGAPRLTTLKKPLSVGWNCHSWLDCWLPQAHCCTAVPLVVPNPVASTQAPLFWLTTLYQALLSMPLFTPPTSAGASVELRTKALAVVHCDQSFAMVAAES